MVSSVELFDLPPKNEEKLRKKSRKKKDVIIIKEIKEPKKTKIKTDEINQTDKNQNRTKVKTFWVRISKIFSSIGIDSVRNKTYIEVAKSNGNFTTFFKIY